MRLVYVVPARPHYKTEYLEVPYSEPQDKKGQCVAAADS